MSVPGPGSAALATLRRRNPACYALGRFSGTLSAQMLVVGVGWHVYAITRDPLARDVGFGVYVHWPFCKAKCPYCDFNSHVRHEPVAAMSFAEALAQDRDGLQHAAEDIRHLAESLVAQGLGAEPWRTVVREVLPNVSGTDAPCRASVVAPV